ncbi:MAG: DUF6438 domain-containing protein [Saprospiraceae bacterium]
MKILSFILLLTVFLAQDCKNRKNKESLPEMESSEVIPVVKLMKNACFGKCPMYSLTLYNNGKAEYVGRANVEKLGTFTKQIPTEKVASILRQLNAVKFWDMEDKYMSELSDTQKTIMTQFRKDTSKTVTGDHARPDILKPIEKELIAIADDSADWTKTKDHPQGANKQLPKHFIKNEIITEFEKDIDVKAAVATKKQFGLEIKKKIAPNLDMYVLTYDTMRVKPQMMLMQVKRIKGVTKAEFNKRLEPREH